MNNPTWYLATLIQCFIVFELYRYLLKRYTKLKRYLAGGLLGVFSLCLVLHLPTMHWSIVYGRGLVPFFAGIVIFQFLQAGRLPSDFSYLLNLGLVSILLGMVFIPQKLIAHQQYVLIFLLYPAALYYGLRIKRFINNNYIYIYISYISAISFDAYLWHFPVYAGIKFIDQYFNLHIEYTATMMFWLSILIWGLSVISYRCLEKPSGRLTKRIENKLSGILL